MNEEIIDVVEIETVEEVEMDETIGWYGGDATSHDSLSDRNIPDQHEIRAITGLRGELDEIKALKSVTSDKVGVANYYKWKDWLKYNDTGYFVSLVPGDSTIQICEGTDIFGVTVPDAGFVGNQAYEEVKNNDGTFRKVEIDRDNTYALVATSGLVRVRCESGIVAGDYVVSRKDGIAIKTDSGCGYKVTSTAFNNDNTISYAVISLGVQACTTDALGQEVQRLDKRVGDAEINIAAIALVADEAYSKAHGTENKTEQDLVDISDKVNNANINASIANTSAENAKKAADDAYKFAQDVQDRANKNHTETLAQITTLEGELSAITGWEDPVTHNTGAEYLKTYINEGLATKIEMYAVETTAEENKLAIEKNAETYQQTMSSVDKYVVGEYSQAYGLTLEQAKNILKEGMVYIPTAHKEQPSHKESYSFTHEGKSYIFEREFTPGYYYVWEPATLQKEIDGDTITISTYMWKDKTDEDEQKVETVWFFDIVPSGLGYDFWYDGEKLYKLMTPTWKNVNKIVFSSSSQPTNAAFPYWFNGTDTVYKIAVGEDGKITSTACTTVVASEEPESAAVEFWCCGSNIYQHTDAVWTKFDKNVFYGELDAATSEYDYCVWNDSFCVLSLDSEGAKRWEPRRTCTEKDTPSYTDYDFWYYGQTLRSLWCEVSTLAGNVNSRLTSIVRQDVDSFTAAITNACGSVAELGAWMNDVDATTQQLSAWKNEDGDLTAAVRTRAGDNGSEVVISSLQKDQDGNMVEAASLTLQVAKDDNGNPTGALTVDASNIDFSAENYMVRADRIDFSSSDLQFERWNLVKGTTEPSEIFAGAFENDKNKEFDLSVALNKGQDYYFSADIEFYRMTQQVIADITAISVDIVYEQSYEEFSIPVSGGRVYGPIKPTNGGYNKIKIYAGKKGSTESNTIIFSKIKLEQGTAPTKWAPAIEDYAASEQVGHTMNWRMLPEKCVWWNEKGSEENYLMKLDKDGLSISGEVEAKTGSIGGWQIDDYKIFNGNSGMCFCNSYDADTYMYYKTSLVDKSNVPVRFYAGSPYASQQNHSKFVVLEDGSLYAEAAKINGTITANGGKIGEWNIGTVPKAYINEPGSNSESAFEDALYSTTFDSTDNEGVAGTTTIIRASKSATDYAFLINKKDKDENYTEVFGIKHGGELLATKGQISGWDLDSKRLGKDFAGIYSGDISMTSVFDNETTSKVRIYAGKQNSFEADLDFDSSVLNTGFISVLYNVAQTGGTIGSCQFVSFVANGKTIDDYFTNKKITALSNSIEIEISGFDASQIDGELIVKIRYSYIFDKNFLFDENINNKPPFMVLDDGSLYASAADITGNIHATSGTLGGWVINDKGIHDKDTHENNTIFSPGGLSFGHGDFDNLGGQWIDLNKTGLMMFDDTKDLDYVYMTAYGINTLPTASASWAQIVDKCNNDGSDVRIKNNIETLDDKYDNFFNMLKPVRYKYNFGTSDRYHTGFIAQDVLESLNGSGLNTKDFAALIIDNEGLEDERWYLRRDEFVSLNTWQIQKLKKRIEELEKTVEGLSNK